jgi:hypothetical protein
MVFAILVVALVGITLSLAKTRKLYIHIPILSATFIIAFVCSTALFGMMERIKDSLQRTICLDVYTLSSYNETTKICTVRLMAKNGKFIEVPIPEPAFNGIVDQEKFKEEYKSYFKYK